MSGEIVVLSTSSQREAQTIAKTLVSEKLAACVNIIDKVNSVYTWKEKLVEDTEALLIIKTHSEIWTAVRKRLAELNSYEVPEIISLEIKDGHAQYLDWLAASVRAN